MLLLQAALEGVRLYQTQVFLIKGSYIANVMAVSYRQDITADILAKMENAEKIVKKGGYLIMSGIIDKFEKPLLDKFLKKGFVLQKRETDGIWVGLLLKNKE